MQELDDITLLREYTERDSEEAFGALVARHVNKVYSVALRHTRNPHQAEEITQAVFVLLAQKSRHLGKRVVVSGWLYQTARLTAVTFIRSEIRRARREEETHMQTLSEQAEGTVWPQIAPLLDTAIAKLSEADRHAVVLRFFDGKSMREVGAALGASEDAAKMRVNRAVDKLRLFFRKQGVVVGADALEVAISVNSVQAAPAALAKTATAVAMAKGTTASISTLTLIKGALKLMAWTKAKTVTVGAVVLAVLVAAPLAIHFEQTRDVPLPDHLSTGSLAPEGYQTPEAALNTLLWAITRANFDAVMASATPQQQAKMENDMKGTSREAIVAKLKSNSAKVKGYTITGQRRISSDVVVIDVRTEGMDKAMDKADEWTFRKVGGEWKFE